MWLDLIKDTTKYIVTNTKEKRLTLIHPHFKTGKRYYKELIRTLENNDYHGYRVEIIGFASLKGLLILNRLMKHLHKLDIVSYYNIECNFPNPIYTINLTLK